MSLIRKHGAVLQAWACLDLVKWAIVSAILAFLTQRTQFYCFYFYVYFEMLVFLK